MQPRRRSRSRPRSHHEQNPKPHSGPLPHDQSKSTVEVAEKRNPPQRVDLEDTPPSAWKRTTLSIVKPAIRVARTHHYYLISAAFCLQMGIKSFEEEDERFNRFFSSISLRYLFNQGEHHEFKPHADHMRTANVTHTSEKEHGVSAGLSVDALTTVSPSLEYQFMANDVIEVEETGLRSWRKGVSIEKYPHNLHCPYELPLPLRTASPHHIMIKFFRVNHKLPHQHRSHLLESICDPYEWHDNYECAIHWFWQRSADANLWAPEVYQSVTFPITVTRKVWIADAEEAARKHNLADLLHFDFEVEARVRELGHTMRRFHSSSKPPDLKVKLDVGELKPSELWSFCVSCLPELNDIRKWPDSTTLNMEEDVREIVKEKERIPHQWRQEYMEEIREARKKREKREKENSSNTIEQQSDHCGCPRICCKQNNCASHCHACSPTSITYNINATRTDSDNFVRQYSLKHGDGVWGEEHTIDPSPEGPYPHLDHISTRCHLESNQNDRVDHFLPDLCLGGERRHPLYDHPTEHLRECSELEDDFRVPHNISHSHSSDKISHSPSDAWKPREVEHRRDHSPELHESRPLFHGRLHSPDSHRRSPDFLARHPPTRWHQPPNSKRSSSYGCHYAISPPHPFQRAHSVHKSGVHFEQNPEEVLIHDEFHRGRSRYRSGRAVKLELDGYGAHRRFSLGRYSLPRRFSSPYYDCVPVIKVSPCRQSTL